MVVDGLVEGRATPSKAGFFQATAMAWFGSEGKSGAGRGIPSPGRGDAGAVRWVVEGSDDAIPSRSRTPRGRLELDDPTGADASAGFAAVGPEEGRAEVAIEWLSAALLSGVSGPRGPAMQPPRTTRKPKAPAVRLIARSSHSRQGTCPEWVQVAALMRRTCSFLLYRLQVERKMS
jgi:hypothetical protein